VATAASEVEQLLAQDAPSAVLAGFYDPPVFFEDESLIRYAKARGYRELPLDGLPEGWRASLYIRSGAPTPGAERPTSPKGR
jgi:hypothetical protein